MPLLPHFLMETVHDDLSSAALEVEEEGNEARRRQQAGYASECA